MPSLTQARVLLVSASETDRDHLTIWLRSEGAELRPVDWSDPWAELKRFSPNVLVLDLRGREEPARALIDRVRQDAMGRALIILVLTARGDVAPARADRGLEMPVHPAEIVAAVATLRAEAVPDHNVLSRDAMVASLIEARAASSDLRGMLQLLNASGPFRYTAVLRFEPDETLTSMWTFDRENPELNAFPEGKLISDSYCSRLRDAMAPFEVADSEFESSVAQHPARHGVLSYCGVPLMRQDGSMYGSLCQFDVKPRYFPQLTVKRLLEAAALMRQHWPELR